MKSRFPLVIGLILTQDAATLANKIADDLRAALSR
jgi:hypothetical protein